MKFGNVKLPKELWMCEDEQARWFEFEQPHDLPDSVTVTKMIPEQAEKQDPVAWVNQANLNSAAIQRNRRGQGDTHTWSETPTWDHSVPLYTSPPPSQPWFGLTDEEIDKTYETQVWDARRSYARAIEAKLKEKNT